MNCTPSAVLLQIVLIAVATSSGVKVNTFTLLDSGSQTSLILEEFSDAIGLVSEDSALQLGPINSTEDRVLSSLTATEIHNTEMIAAQKGQRDSFHLDTDALRANKRLPARSRLSAINPYVDEAECFRVSGRLRKAPFSEETKHPLILDPKHETTRPIVMHNHQARFERADTEVLDPERPGHGSKDCIKLSVMPYTKSET